MNMNPSKLNFIKNLTIKTKVLTQLKVHLCLAPNNCKLLKYRD